MIQCPVVNNRITKLEQLMKFAEVASLRSHDSETKVGCVLVDSLTHEAKSSACNGFVRGAPDKSLPNTRPEKYKYVVHSEANLIASCARNGMSTKNSYLVCTHSPCVACMRLLYQSGISKVIIKNRYSDFLSLLEMADLSIKEEATPEGFTVLTYSPKTDLS